MKKKCVLLLMVLSMLCNSVCFAAETESEVQEEGAASIDGFRDIKWGTNIEDVKSDVITDNMVDGSDYGISENTITIINSTVAGYDAYTYFEFDDNSKLNGGMYVLTETHTNMNDYYDDYCDLVDLYTDKYGEPVKVVEDWKNDLYKNDPEHLGLAISAGHVVYCTFWADKDGAQIVIALHGDNFKISHAIQYTAPEYETTRDTSGI